MEITKEAVLGITFINEEISLGMSLISKLTTLVNKEASSVKIKKTFTPEEVSLINEINNSIGNE